MYVLCRHNSAVASTFTSQQDGWMFHAMMDAQFQAPRSEKNTAQSDNLTKSQNRRRKLQLIKTPYNWNYYNLNSIDIKRGEGT